MPTYEYACDNCSHGYEEFRSISKPHPKKCPKCKQPYGDKFRQVYGTPNFIMANQPTTVGQQAEINAKRMGKERMQMMQDAAKQRKSKFKGKLPAGAKINTTGSDEPPWFRSGVIKGTEKLAKPLDVSKIKDTEKFIRTGEKT